MKKMIGLLLVFCMVLSACSAFAMEYYSEFDYALQFNGGVDRTFPSTKVYVRTGPSTEFTGRATYTLQNARVISKSVDNRGATWVQIEFKYHGQLTRGYTTSNVVCNVSNVPAETTFNEFTSMDEAAVYDNQWAYTGPGYEYMRSDDFYLTTDQCYWLVGVDGDWCLLQTLDTGYPMWRGWVPTSEVQY